MNLNGKLRSQVTATGGTHRSANASFGAPPRRIPATAAALAQHAAARWLKLLMIAVAVSAALPPHLLGLPRSSQTVVDVSDFDLCASCRIVMRDSLTLGDGPGAPGELMTILNLAMSLSVAEDGTYLVSPRSNSELKLFRSDGVFLRTIGRRGEGPGELMVLADAVSTSDFVYVSDPARALIVVFAIDGSYVSQHRMPFASEFRILPDRRDPNRLIVAARSSQARYVGYPLHLLDLATDSVLVSTGSEDGRYVPAPMDTHILRAEADQASPGRAWLAEGRRFRFERWDVSTGRMERVVRGDMPWFPVVDRYFDGTAPPPTHLLDFVVDRLDRLWVLTREADSRWESNVTTVRTASGGTRAEITDREAVWDTKLRVFDLRNRMWLPGLTWDRGYYYLTLSSEGEAVLYNHFIDWEVGVERLRLRHLSMVPAP